MKRPGAAFHGVAARLCSARTLERLVDPTVADLQSEYENAVRGNRKWESRRILVQGYIALVRVMAVHGGMRVMGFLRYFRGEDRRALIQTAGASAVAMIAGTVVLMAPFASSAGSRPDSAELALYLIPQALPLSIPIGLTFGILWGLGRVAASPRSRTLILLLATIASVASFAMLAWIVPTANQAFRISTIGQPLPKGVNELTLGELRQRLEPGAHEPMSVAGPFDRRSLALNYHARWALSGAPLVLALFAMVLTSRRQWGRMMPFLIGGVMILAYYVIMYSAWGLGLNHTISPFAAAWAPNAAFLMLWLAIMRFGSQRTNGMAVP
jgi:hypothetical protein